MKEHCAYQVCLTSSSKGVCDNVGDFFWGEERLADVEELMMKVLDQWF